MNRITQSRMKIRWLNAKSLILLLFGVFFSFWEGNAQCSVMTTSFSEDFESSATYLDAPDCWEYFVDSGYGYGNTYGYLAHTGVNSYYSYPYNGSEVFLVSPETTDLGNGTKQLRFWAKLGSAVLGAKINVYTLDGNTSTASQTPVMSVPVTSLSWQQYIVPLPATTDDYFAFAFYGAPSTYPTIYLDDIEYEDLWECFFPMNIKVSDITQTEATISWDASGSTGVTSYDYEVRTFGEAGSGATGLVTEGNVSTGTSVDLTGLSAGTDYIVYVRSVCGSSEGEWTIYPMTFSTECGVVGDFYQSFEYATIGNYNTPTVPTCWSYLEDGGGYGYTNNGTGKTGSSYFYAYVSDETEIFLISPETDNLGSGEKQVRFWANLTSASYTGTKVGVYSLDGNDDTANKTLLEMFNLTTTGWQEFTVLLPDTTDDYFAIYIYGAASSYPTVYIDDIWYEDIPEQTLTITKSNNTCFGDTKGFASVAVKDGKPPYSYSWSTGDTSFNVSGLAAGTYTVEVTDDLGRVVEESVTITEPTEIVLAETIKNVSCNGQNDGEISITVTGGRFPYVYQWSNGKKTNSISGLAPDDYTVMVTDANGCVQEKTFTITEPDVLVASVGNQTDVSVYGGSDGAGTINVTGGTEPYTYDWTPSVSSTDTASNLKAGTYTVLITDANGCTATQQVDITEPVPPYQVVLVSQSDATCNGANDGAITIDVTGENPPFKYLWSPSGKTTSSISGLSAGEHTVTVTDDKGEKVIETFTILEPTAITAIIEEVSNVTCNGNNDGSATVTATGGEGAFTYLWSNGETTAKANNLKAGSHFVLVTDANGCQVTENVTIAEPAALVVTASSQTDVSCNGQSDGAITVTTAGGDAPYNYSWSNGQAGATLNNLSGGAYTVTVTDANGCTATQSFTIVEPAVVYPPVAVNQGFCNNSNATLADMVVTGTEIKWYDAVSGGNLLPLTTVVTNGTTYYASQTVKGCESASRTAVQVSLYAPVLLTTTQLDVCGNTRIQDVTIEGHSGAALRWYANATTATRLQSSQLLTSGTYYVSTFVNNACESARQPIVVTVSQGVPTPTASTQTICGNGTVDDLEILNQVQGATLNWYSSLQSTTPLAGSTPVLSGTYYVEQVLGTCASARVAVSVQKMPIPAAPSITAITLCEGATVGELYLNSGVDNYVWYADNNASTQPLSDTYNLTTGQYYVAQEVSGCISNRVKVDVVVNPRPVSPTGNTTQVFGPHATINDLKMNEVNVKWYASYEDAMAQIDELLPNTPLQDKVTYYGVLLGTKGCSSVPTAVEVKIDESLGINDLDLAHLRYYPNPTDSELNISYVEPIKRIEIYNIAGKQIANREFDTKEVKVDLSGYSAGTYIVHIITAEASQYVKVVKR